MIKDLRRFKIIDTHLHLGNLAYLNMPSGSDDKIIDILKKNGVKKAVFSHHGLLSTVEAGFDMLFDVLDEHRDFLYAYLVFNPNHEGLFLDRIKKHISDPGILGIKIHPSWHQCYPHSEGYRRFWEYTSANGIVVLTHSWNPNVPNKAQKYSDPHFFEEVSRRYPAQKIILAHAGGRGEYFYKVMEILKRNENIYVDFAGDTFLPFIIDRYVEGVGSERILFGTDMPWIDVRYHISNILHADISDQDRQNIFGLNAERLFDLKL